MASQERARRRRAAEQSSTLQQPKRRQHHQHCLGRSPEEIVKAVNSAIKADVAVAARRLPSGDTVVTFRESSRPRADETEWVQTALGPDATVNRRVFSVVVKGFPVRLSQNQDREDIRKRLTAANGPGVDRTLRRQYRGPQLFHGRTRRRTSTRRR
ncbi:hypothetical protein E4U39_004752 [Claviceps sp. Clav50 group G5]|nr:hypothetical protein E4U39_004752 [Claviceps sp. Clav50 group G5]